MTDAPNAECLSDATLAEILAGEAAPEDRAAALAHADRCADCRNLLAALLGEDGSDGQPATLRDHDVISAAPKVGTLIDHYRVTGMLGRGAYGIVVAAQDTQLGREVALKLLKPADDRDDRRLLREAQAMATLSHPNVVMVHGVGETDHGIYVAMEKVNGSTLTEWVAEEPRDWEAILEAWIAAGNGLAAAHEAGLVHRDFKPDNVLVRDDGGVLVTDFGLAVAPTGEAESPDDGDPHDQLSVGLTATGAVVGTPRYMAPEQLRAAKIDARADQFAFAVSLYRALYGAFPFAGRSFRELADNVGDGNLVAPDPGHAVPAAVWAVLRRCLQTDPAARYPDIRAVIAGLEAVRSLRARRWRVVAFAGVAIAGIGGGIAFAQRVDAQPCAGVAADLASIWNDRRKERVVAALGSAESTDVATLAPTTAARIDAYAQRWTSTRSEVCRSALVDRSVPEPVFDQQSRCLDHLRRYLAAAIDVLSAPAADRGTLQGVSDLIAHLGRPERCKSAIYVASEAALPTGERDAARAAEILDEVAHSWALSRTYKPARALELAVKAYDDAVALAHDPVTFEAVNQLTAAHRRANDVQSALAVARDAYKVSHDAPKRALVRHHLLLGELLIEDEQAEAALIELRKAEAIGSALEVAHPSVLSQISNVLLDAGDGDEALRYATVALATAEDRFGAEAGVVALYQTRLSVAQAAVGDSETALATAEKALAIAIAEYGEDHERVVTCLANLASHQRTVTGPEAALQTSQRALELIRQVPDPEPETVAWAHEIEVDLLFGLGRNDQAIEVGRRSVQLHRDLYGREHDATATAIAALGRSEFFSGDNDGALRHYSEAVEIWTKLRGAESPRVATTRSNIASVKMSLGRFAEAVEEARAAQAQIDLVRDPSHVDNGTSLGVLGEASYAVGDCTGAATAFRRAYEVQAQHLPDNHPQLAITVDKIAFTLQLARRFEDAAAQHRKALAMRTAADKPYPPGVAATRASLAVALARGGKREDARAQLELARSFRPGKNAAVWLSPIVELATAIVQTEVSPPPADLVASIASARTQIRTYGIVDWRMLVDDWVAGPGAPPCPVDPP